MTPRQVKFVAEYLIDLNATQAALRAGYSAKTAEHKGHLMLRQPEIATALAEAQAKRLWRADLTAETVLEQLRRLVTFDIADLYDAGGRLKPVHDWPVHARSAVAGVKTKELFEWNAATEERELVGYTQEVKLSSRVEALQLAMRHLALLVDRTEVNHTGTIEHKIAMMTPDERRARAIVLVEKARQLAPPPANAA